MKSIKVMNAGCDSNILFIAEHTGKDFPGGYGTLGLTPEVLETISDYYDNGARRIITALTEQFHATSIFANYSRLLIDLNRKLDHPQLIREKEDDWDISIPANNNISDEERKRRIQLYYKPYHKKVKQVIEKKLQEHERVYVFVIHTCSTTYHGELRDFDVDVMYIGSQKLAQCFGTFMKDKGYKVNYNEPYNAKLSATMVGYPEHKVEWICIETNQKTIATYNELHNYILAVTSGIKKCLE
jgi:predicted N-formylglutamate amidohydrolase